MLLSHVDLRPVLIVVDVGVEHFFSFFVFLMGHQWQLQNQRTSTRWVFRELLGSEDIFELFPNHIRIYPPKVTVFTILQLSIYQSRLEPCVVVEV